MLTIREKCLEVLAAAVESISAGTPANDPYSVSWGIATRARLPEDAGKKRYAVGIYDTKETKRPNVSTYDCELSVVIEFNLHLDSKQVPSVEANRVLGELQRKIREDTTLGSNALDVVETGNELYIDDDDDSVISGALFLMIRYRHSINDPRKPV